MIKFNSLRLLNIYKYVDINVYLMYYFMERCLQILIKYDMKKPLNTI